MTKQLTFDVLKEILNLRRSCQASLSLTSKVIRSPKKSLQALIGQNSYRTSLYWSCRSDLRLRTGYTVPDRWARVVHTFPGQDTITEATRTFLVEEPFAVFKLPNKRACLFEKTRKRSTLVHSLEYQLFFGKAFPGPIRKEFWRSAEGLPNACCLRAETGALFWL